MLLPHERIVQLGFVSRDVRATMDAMTRNLGVGPFFLRERTNFSRQSYMGKPTKLTLAVAMGYKLGAGLQYEIIQQLDDEPSIYKELMGANGGFHHFGIGTKDFDRSVATCGARGLQSVYEAEVPGNSRVCYFDTRKELPAMIEYIEMNPDLEAAFESDRAASEGWNGIEPVRLRQPRPQE